MTDVRGPAQAPELPKLLTWSIARRILEQGAAIQQDYAAGNYANCEDYAARMDAAAREIIDEYDERFG